MIYVDYCNEQSEKNITDNFGCLVVKRMAEKDWSINESIRLLTASDLKLAVFNQINEITIMEIALLQFMCKPILITSKAINEYPILRRTCDHIAFECDLTQDVNSFVNWYKKYIIGE